VDHGSKAGIRVGDVITKIDDIEINKMSELRKYIYTKRPNDTVKVTIIRNNKERNLNMTLGKKI
jgi:S1-C subfamily serine protease